MLVTHGKGSRIFDDNGKDYIESVAGLWCASLGFGVERLARVAYEQMSSLGYYHSYRHRTNEPNINLAEKASFNGACAYVKGPVSVLWL